MVMSVLEARVSPEQWETLRAAYGNRASVLPPGIVESFLVQSSMDPESWRIMTIWRSREDLAAMRQPGGTPTGVLIFRDAGAEPTHTAFAVWANPRAEASQR
jgi:Antibiotic biosynthesis monooxygenase